MKYANIISAGSRLRNYGEDIQLLAIEFLYEYMGIPYDQVVRITVNDLFSYDGEEYLLVPINWPFWGKYNKLSEKIIPVYLGISAIGDSIVDDMRFREFQPIGCRDQRTFELCRKNGIEAYINGCMSLTFPKTEVKGQSVYIVDVCEELLEYIPDRIKDGAIYKTHVYYNREISEEESASIYQEYQENARMVISSRLHCIIPCIAYGIPVIYASKFLSTRSNWLKKIIPVYDEQNFKNIDWNPEPLNIEDLKKLLLKNAARRMRETYNKYFLRCSLTERFYDLEQHKLIPEDLREAVGYIENNWSKEKTYKYVVWGITQTAYSLYEFISEKYKKAMCVGVIDLYRRIEFKGMMTQGLEILDDNNDVIVFVTAESIHAMAMQVFKDKHIRNYVLCWKNYNYRMEDGSI